MSKKNTKLSAETLRDLLWETMNLVKTKKLSHAQANAVATQSREIMRTIRTEIEVAKLCGAKPGSKLLSFHGNKES